MAFLKHDPHTFATEAAAGFAQVHSDTVQGVPGGVVRTTRSEQDEVAVVIGGGSGHYPAFAGLVGPGLAHGAVLGNIFASPSSHQVESVARAVEQGRGVLLSYGNYAGDRLQFDAAAERLKASGIDVHTVRVTDDVSSAPPEQASERRGIAGDLIVFKVAGAAAARGDCLQDVAAAATRANQRTRSMGVAFTGCSLPGQPDPLFDVPKGRMAVGMGIHGEPGLDELDVPTPAQLAQLLVDRLMAEAPEDGRRVVTVVNGLGAFKHDEMYVLHRHIDDILTGSGVEVADSRVGEFCTSFEMAGVSLTLFWLDKKLEELWTASAHSPEFTSGTASTAPTRALKVMAPTEGPVSAEATDDASRQAAGHVAGLLGRVRDLMDAKADELGRLDAIAGDGDHGIGMQNGSRAAAEAAASAAAADWGAGQVLTHAGDAWQDGAGGTSGALWGTILRQLGQAIGNIGAPTQQSLTEGLRSAMDAVMEMGGAAPGDKTMVDALVPFTTTFAERADLPVVDAWVAAAQAARTGAEATTDMAPGLGRARSHGDQAIGTPDPGAISFTLIVEDLSTHLTPR